MWGNQPRILTFRLRVFISSYLWSRNRELNRVWVWRIGMRFVSEFDLMLWSWVCCLIFLWHSSFSGFVVNVLGLLFIWIFCSAQWVCCLISLWHISFYGFVIHSDSLIITVNLLSDLLWHSSFLGFLFILFIFLSFHKQDFRGNWEFVFGLGRALWSFQVVLMGSMSTSVMWLKCLSLQLN